MLPPGPREVPSLLLLLVVPGNKILRLWDMVFLLMVAGNKSKDYGICFSFRL